MRKNKPLAKAALQANLRWIIPQIGAQTYLEQDVGHVTQVGHASEEIAHLMLVQMAHIRIKQGKAIAKIQQV